ncbi:asparagine synthase (glutamine-hydrolyzing) [Candidatus Amesbacteria bacterium]|nr:asparagine synthase (glutamine-hydrolyzing) [Candidatus Amesbacteria bacterium]
MCGIAGKIYLNSGTVKEAELAEMSGKIMHRGPDDWGIFISKDKRVGLVSRRLAIIDLSEKGHQPMEYKGRYRIVFNGEIYNFQQVSKRLEKMGYKFRSQSDTEVILAMYDKYGTGCLEYLRGMFAFAVYDAKNGTVFLARDRMGVKPLKYYWDGKTFIFASELKAILTQREVKRHPDWLAIHYYLTLGYCPAPCTGFEKIYKLEPASYLLINLRSGQIEKKKYWHLDFGKKLNLSQTEWKERILTELEAATKLRMISDVPVGAFLSGGVDSSAVVALMAKNSSRPIKTFTIGFEDPNDDERQYAKTIAKKFGTDHLELVVGPQSLEILPEVVRQYEEPFADSSAVITYMVSKLAGKFVKVILNGDGGDESYCGYLRHNKLQRDFWLGRFNRLLPAASVIGLGWPRLARFINRQDVDIRERYLEYNCYFTRSEKLQIYRSEFEKFCKDFSVYRLWNERCDESLIDDVRDQLLYTDLTYYFPDSQLTKVDMASMAASLEARSPFTDHKMMELAASIPYNFKVRNGIDKYILKKSLEGLVPRENLYRKKMGFTIPLVKWFGGELKEYTLAQMSKPSFVIRHMLKRGEVERMIREHNPAQDYGPKLWNLLTLDLWYREYFKD